MAETLKIALRGFLRGFVDLGRGFDWSCQTGQCAADRFIVSLAQVFAFLLTVLLLQCGTYLIAADKPLGGYASLTADPSAPASAFFSEGDAATGRSTARSLNACTSCAALFGLYAEA